MKILIVSTFDVQGGASIAASRIHKALLKQDVDSQMLVQYKRGFDKDIISEDSKTYIFLNKIRPILDDVPTKFYKNRTKTFFSPAIIPSNRIIKKINSINPDIVHLHWVCAGMIRIEDLVKIEAPIVWSLHDNWAFTGGCHYADGCKLYELNCGRCKILGSQKNNDLSRKIFNIKQRAFVKINNLTVVGVSQWITECSKKSTLLKNKKHINLPNPINVNIFKKINKSKARKFLNLNQNKRLILFGAIESTSDARKGFKELKESLNNLRNEDVELVVFGNKEKKQSHDLGFKTHYLGHINDDKKLVQLYSAADVMVVPSLQEAFGQTASEAMSCSTPVVAFAATGLLDIVNHKKNGYLAKPFDTGSL